MDTSCEGTIDERTTNYRTSSTQKNWGIYTSRLALVLISTLLFLSSCASFSITAQNQATPAAAAKVKITPAKPLPTTTPSSVTPAPTQSPTNFYDEISLL
ncbi:MAG: hypothetical protein ACXWPS_14175, partial [Ktedonobacteraceae bacterium]